MKSLEERKLVLVSQIHQLRRQLDNLKQQDYLAAQLSICKGRSGYLDLYRADSKCL